MTARLITTLHTLALAVACAPAAVVIAWQLVAWDLAEQRAKRGAR